jgi:hypothetical protein
MSPTYFSTLLHLVIILVEVDHVTYLLFHSPASGYHLGGG